MSRNKPPATDLLFFPLTTPFALQSGNSLNDARLAYKTWGSQSNPLIVFPTSYTAKLSDNSWLVNEEGLNSLKDYFVVQIGQFGGAESSSPSNTKGDQAGSKFPTTTVFDNVKAQHELIMKLFNPKEIFCVLGWSMGSAQSFAWATQYPDLVKRIVPFCGAARTAEHNKTFLNALLQTIRNDPEFHSGDYTVNQTQQSGKKAFAAIYSGFGFSTSFYREKLYQKIGFATLEDFLVGFWEGFFCGKDANDLIHQLKTWMQADITPISASLTAKDGFLSRSSDEDYYKALASIKAKALIIPGLTDSYFPPEDSKIEADNIPNATLVVIQSIYGHFAGGGLPGSLDSRFIDQQITKFFNLTT